jgi:hypothetical protein
MMGSDDIRRMMKEVFFMLLCYSLYFTLIILLGIKLWTRIK